jgi:hypothetical protein
MVFAVQWLSTLTLNLLRSPNPVRLWIFFTFVFFYATRAFDSGSGLTRTRIWLGKWIYSISLDKCSLTCKFRLLVCIRQEMDNFSLPNAKDPNRSKASHASFCTRKIWQVYKKHDKCTRTILLYFWQTKGGINDKINHQPRSQGFRMRTRGETKALGTRWINDKRDKCILVPRALRFNDILCTRAKKLVICSQLKSIH